MIRKLILIAGPPASGKTFYATHLSQMGMVPVFSKDRLKELMYDTLKFQVDNPESVKKYGAVAYKNLFYIAESLMTSGVDFSLESNFTAESVSVLLPMVHKYRYSVLTVLFDASSDVLYQRFTERDKTAERHPGLGPGVYQDLPSFRNLSDNARRFRLEEGAVIKIDSTDFKNVDYSLLDKEVKKFLKHDFKEEENAY